MSYLLVYVTCKDAGEARRIASAVIGEKLAACANIFQPHDSFYWWEEAVRSEREVAMILKTTAERFEALKSRIAGLHSYDTPCVVAMPIAAGHEPFLRWIAAQAGGAGE